MSNRTAEANKAIAAKWEEEQRLVREGMGTRDWTPEQQRDILDENKGKAYDENGRAFQGHHMKSVEKYPEYQGDPGNIQFLTKAEHWEAHQGSWQNPTNGYYDPITKHFFDFGNGPYIPCQPKKLSNPIIDIANYDEDTTVDAVKPAEEPGFCNSAPQAITNKVSIGDAIDGTIDTVKKFVDKHPLIAAVATTGIGIVVTAVSSKVIGTKAKANQVGHTGHNLPMNEIVKTVAKPVLNAVSNFDFKKSESVLKQFGYTVAKNIGLSDTERQKILREIITSGVATKEEVCAFLGRNINLHKGQEKMTEAVGKWMADLAYIKEV